MEAESLEQRLLEAASNDGWVDVLAAYFDEHALHFGHGTDNAGDEAFWLIRHLQDWRDGAWDAPPDPKLAAPAAATAVRRVRERRPLAYLLGEGWLAGLRFKVTDDVLIPRSPIAELIEHGFAPWCALEPGDRVLDVGTGSGCLAVACACRWPELAVDATEVSPRALAVAAQNVARHGVERRVRLVEADLFPPGRRRYRVIMSNPPYVPADALGSLPPEYAHEPALALAGGATGIDPACRLIEGAFDYLTPDGLLVVEVGLASEALAAAYPRLGLTWVELERGGEGVFVVQAGELSRYFELDP